MKKLVIDAITQELQREFVLEKPANLSFGHYATPIAFSLAKELRKSPIAIAEELSERFSADAIFQDVSALKGYINFKLSPVFLDSYATWALEHENDFERDSQGTSI